MKSHPVTQPPGQESPANRRLALTLAFGLALTLALVVTANAYVARKTETTLADFDSGTFSYTGLLDLPDQKPPIDSVQLLPIGLTGSWETSGQSLPVALANLGATALGDRFYVAGGTDTNQLSRDLVYSTQVVTRGALTPWQTQTPLPEARAGVALAVHPRPAAVQSILYAVGGIDPDDTPSNTIFRAPVNNTTGAVGTWSTDTQPLPVPLYQASAVVHDGALYVIGGFGQSGVLDRVDYATINGNGSLDAFAPTEPLTMPLYYGFPIVYDGPTTDTLYLIGGRDLYTSTFHVLFADFVEGGGLNPWKASQGSLPYNLYGHSAALYNGEIIVTGGIANSLDKTTGMTSTIKAALVDPDNPAFRLYDWCEGVGTPDCTIGAWQTGALLPDERDLHATLVSGGYFYVIGGEDRSENIRADVLYGTVNGVGSLYAPEGEYLADPLDLGVPADLVKLAWGATIGYPGQMSLSLQYRHRQEGSAWSAWSAPVDTVSGTNQIDLDPSADPSLRDIRYVQYQVSFTTEVSRASPLLDWVEVYYEVEDPDLRVTKHTGAVITVPAGSELEYTILYTNTGEWVAENAVLTETLPEYTSYVGGGDWHQVGSTNVFTHALGDVGRGVQDSLSLVVQSSANTPTSTRFLTNTVALDYPPMLDAFSIWVTDPTPENNIFRWINPLRFLLLDIGKVADPPSGSPVVPTQLITYTLNYANDGDDPLYGLVLTDSLPSDLVEYVANSIWGPGADDSQAPLLRWTLGDLGQGQAGSAGFRVRVTGQPGGVIQNAALATSAENLLAASNATSHPIISASLQLQLDKSATPPSGSQVLPGDGISYTLRYTNGGSMPLLQVRLTDTLPSELTFQAGTLSPATCTYRLAGHRIECDLNTLPQGTGGTVVFGTTVRTDLTAGTSITNTFVGNAANAGLRISNATVHHVPFTELALAKSATPPSGSLVDPPTTIDYTLRVTNTGDTPLTGVIVTDIVPSGVSYVPGSILPAYGDDSDPTRLIWSLPAPLGQGASVSLGFQVNVPSGLSGGTVITNRAIARCDQVSLPSGAETEHAVRNPDGPDLTPLSLYAFPPAPSVGSPFTVSSTIANIGASDAITYFWTKIYLLPASSSDPSGPGDHSGGVDVEGIWSMAQGVSQDLTFDAPAIALPSGGPFKLCAQVDVAFAGDSVSWGRIVEADETNNLLCKPIQSGNIYLPLVMRAGG
jgi:uncharacterized repeat protein (TIGR01451 family)